MSGFLQDLRSALRMVAREPGLACVAALSLAIGIGVNTTIFSMLDAWISRPLPIEGVKRLVGLSGPFSLAELRELRRSCQTLEDTVLVGRRQMQWKADGRSGVSSVELTSYDYFSALRLVPELGRFFSEGDARSPAEQPPAVISYRMWQEAFAGDRAVLGRTIELGAMDTPDSRNATIVGVAPRDFNGVTVDLFNGTHLWLPIEAVLGTSNGKDFLLVGRLRAGVARRAAQDELQTKLDALRFAEKRIDRIRLMHISRMGLVPERVEIVTTLLAQSIFVVLLLLACTNVACLLVARSATRRHELGIRLALGCSRWRLMRSVLAESLVLSVLGALLAMLLTYWALDLAPLTVSRYLPVLGLAEAHLDARVVLSACAFALIAAVISSLIPVSPTSSAQLLSWLQIGASGHTPRHERGGRPIALRALVGVTVVFLTMGLLFVRSALQGPARDPGAERFDRKNVLFVSYHSRQPSFYEDLRLKLGARPGVRAVSRARNVPYAPWMRALRCDAYVAGRAMGEVGVNYIDAGFLDIIGVRPLQGRGLTISDVRSGASVALASEALRRQAWPKESAVGKFIRLGGARGKSVEIVGVVEDISYGRDVSSRGSLVYLPASYPPLDGRLSSGWTSMLEWTLVVETEGRSASLAGALAAEMRTLDPDVIMMSARTLSQLRDLAWNPERGIARFLFTLGALALTLTALGVYGLVSFLVAHQMREIGIRRALGASQRVIIVSVLGRSAELSLGGIVIGVPITLAVAVILRSSMRGFSAFDPIAYGLAILIVLASALAAGYLPASRAARIDPMEALRCE